MIGTIRLQKRTYALPADVLEPFERAVTSGRRGQAVAQAMREWLEARRREELRREVIAGCHDMAEVYREVEREYHPLEEEVECRAAAASANDK